MEKIPEHILEAINCGEKNASDFYEKYGKDEVCQALERVRKSDEEIFGKYDSVKIYESVEKKLNSNCERKIRFGGKKFYSFQKFVPLAVAAALLVMVLPGIYKNNSMGTGLGEIDAIDGSEINVRIKGEKVSAPKLNLYQLTENGVEVLKSGANAGEGDLIQIAINPGQKKFGIVFSVDGNGNVTNHFGGNNTESQEMPSKLTYLDYSYELDDAPEFEVFCMICGDRPLDQVETQKITEALKNRKLNQLKNAKAVKKSLGDGTLGESFEITTFVLIK